ncbi:MAG: ECF transporter S component [Intestinibacter sp.]|uniref:ECF transporter S component n=1 Tax=Intestinibacter sp. TaxID=1965304 RepID=UPI0025C41A83|nr:ECF transporter S component [Intestinibacter sp.]MCI6738480.1 ECF transporter S component [Intestinibacter sp.]
MQQSVKVKQTKMSTRVIAQIGILSAIAYLLRFFEIPLPIFPPFLKIDLSDVVAVFGGISMGPVAGFVIVVVKNLLQAITGSTTGGVGEFANILIAGPYVLMICLFCKKVKSYKNVLIGAVLGTIAMAIVGAVVDYFIVFPLYAKVMVPMEVIIQMGTVLNPRVTDLFSFMIWLVVPFNIVKGAIMTVVILPLYKKVEKILAVK